MNKNKNKNKNNNNNNNNVKNKIKICLMLFVLSFIFLNVIIGVSINNKNNIVRLHVIANSNNFKDKLIKLKVNENVTNYINSLNISANASSTDVLNILKDNSSEILNITKNTLDKENIDYTYKLEIGKIYYNDKKENDLISMDKGVYNSARLILGEGKGENIWSFIFPNKENIAKIYDLETIIPHISNLYDDTDISRTYKSYIIVG